MKKLLLAAALFYSVCGNAQNTTVDNITIRSSLKLANKKIVGIKATSFLTTDTNRLPTVAGVVNYVAANAGWKLTGNSEINSTDFIGTNDANDFVVKANNIQRVIYRSGGSSLRTLGLAGDTITQSNNLSNTPMLNLRYTGTGAGTNAGLSTNALFKITDNSPNSNRYLAKFGNNVNISNAGVEIGYQLMMLNGATINTRNNGFHVYMENEAGISIGYAAKGIAGGGITIGNYTATQNYQQTAVGYGATANGLNQMSCAFGTGAWAKNAYTTALGGGSRSLGQGSISINGGVAESNYEFSAGGVGFNAVPGSEYYPITDVYFGSGKKRGYINGASIAYNTGSGIDYTINGSGASGTDLTGGNIKIAGGKGTGAGTPGNVIIQTSTPQASGTALQSLTDRLIVSPTGVTISNSTEPTTPTNGGVFWIDNGTLKYKSQGGTITTIAAN